MVLLKAGRTAVPSAYRPICLLDEAGKLSERIIADCLVQHLTREVPGLHEEQYGFREGRSTIDAIIRIKSLMESITEEGRVALAVSLDIVNAFSTLSWEQVGEAMTYFGFPQYLVETPGDGKLLPGQETGVP